VSELPGLERLDFIYMPSPDAARDLRFYADVLGGEIVFAIERFGTRVGQIRLGEERPRVMVAEHLEGEAPFLVFRVDDLEATISELERRGAEIGERFGIPHGPGVALRTPGDQRLALYELTRPGAEEMLSGRRDF
jgi:catechol 2,3-dioxygenase-like lactoylglutathione lyase family enzyme